ncbi:protein of unknown function [Xenorhabdus doucetiae]|uniref:Uncharacterized protein n=1 Tax=Xenorhabdus doucetiae TaxID=351671 RepID=A0A068QWF2_9GAMM|nr:protein of unknown function [Xenorhabdus doucetiae]
MYLISQSIPVEFIATLPQCVFLLGYYLKFKLGNYLILFKKRG